MIRSSREAIEWELEAPFHLHSFAYWLFCLSVNLGEFLTASIERLNKHSFLQVSLVSRLSLVLRMSRRGNAISSLDGARVPELVEGRRTVTNSVG